MMKPILLAALATAAFAAPASAQTDVKVDQRIIYGTEVCPAGDENTIVVCARKPEEERYRIPGNLRSDGQPTSEAWANKALELSTVGRSGIGSCSPTGPGGQIGCLNQLIQQARAERADSDNVNWTRLIEEARQERLGKIDEAAAATEDELNPRN